MNILISWVGQADLNGIKGSGNSTLGPVASAAVTQEYDRICLLNNYPAELSESYLDWLQPQISAKISLHHIALESPTAYRAIYLAALHKVEALHRQYPKACLTFHLSPGTPAMSAVWIILAQMHFPTCSRLIEASREAGVRAVSFPFRMAVEYISDQAVTSLSESRPPLAPAFEDIIHQSDSMRRVLEMAQHIAQRDLPVLIEGESGTGKELLARAIHESGLRRGNTFQAVNCGAIPPDLVEASLFGHKKGAFTGAVADAKGYFREADHGTLFLDEIGELPLAAQVKFLRAIQEGEVIPLGETRAVPVNVRIIAATNRNLVEEVAAGRFRSDLFYRLAVAVLQLPPLRERGADKELLLESILERINNDPKLPGGSYKKLSPAAKNSMLAHSWPGNVRELENTLTRAHLWATSAVITEADARGAIFSIPKPEHGDILNLPLGNGFALPELLGRVSRNYLERALLEAGNNKTKAAKLLGLASYQTLDYWLKRYSVHDDDL